MESIRGVHILLWTEAAFSYGIETIKSLNQVRISNELWLEFVTPHDIPRLYLYVSAVFAFILAGLSDSIIGRFYPTMLGLSMACIGGIIHILRLTGIYTTIAYAFLFGYIITSTLRILLLLEQMRIPKHNDSVRKYIFFMIFLKCSALCLSRIVYEHATGMGDEINKAFSVAIIFAYIFWFMIFVVIFYIESVYFGIWYYTLLYGLKSLGGRSPSVDVKVNKPPVLRDRLFSVKDNKKTIHLDEPAATVELYGLRFIMYHVRYNPGPAPPKTAPAPEPVQEHSYLNNMKHVMRRFFQLSESNKSHQEADEPEEYIPLGKTESKLLNVDRKSKYVNYQLHRFYHIFPILLSSVFFTLLDYFVDCVCTIQSTLFVREEDVLIHSIDVSYYNHFLDLFLLLFVEFVVFPVTKSAVKRDIVYYLIGFGFLIASSLLLVIFEAKAYVGRDYLPGPRVAQIRVINGLSTEASISSSKFQRKIIIQPFEFEVVEVDTEAKKGEMSITFKSGEKEGKTFTVDYTESGTTTYVMLPLMTNLNDFIVSPTTDISLDPNPFGLTNNRFLSTYFVISALPAYQFEVAHLKFTNINRNVSKDIVQQIGSPDRKYYIEPGVYSLKILSYHDLKMNVTVASDNIEFVEDKLYLILIYYEKATVNAKIFFVDEPLSVSYTVTIAQILFSSIARSLATVSFFRFLYLEGPHKLRGLVFITPYFFNSILVSVFDKSFISEKVHGVQLTIIIIVVTTNAVLYGVWIYFGLKFPHRYKKYE